MYAAIAALPREPLVWLRMTDTIKEAVLLAFRRVMTPLVRILLRHGISFGEFAEIVKGVYVDIAQREFTLPAGRQSQSRIAIITGLTRKEVARLVEVLGSDSLASASNLNRVGRVLSGWHQDPDFTGPYGIPHELAFDAPYNRRSFVELVRRYSGDMPPRAMLDELIRVGAAIQLSSGQIRATARLYIPAKTDPALLDFMAVALTDLAETLDHNLEAPPDDKLFERRVWTPAGIPTDMVQDFRYLAAEKGQQFLEYLDDWLSTRETAAVKAKIEDRTRVGVAVYLFVRRRETVPEPQ